MHLKSSQNSLQYEQQRNHLAFHTFSCNHASVKVQASSRAYSAAVFGTNNRLLTKQLLIETENGMLTIEVLVANR